MKSVITVNDMCLWYGDHQALKNVISKSLKGALPPLSALPVAASLLSSKP